MDFKPHFFMLLTGMLLLGCQTREEHYSVASEFDVQGHRGCRGLYPENSISAMIHALSLGVTTLEMDVVITKDGEVILSHEPYLSHEICLTQTGDTITPAQEKDHNLFEMTLEEVQACDCGSKVHPRFPEQKKLKVVKPTLSAVIDTAEAFALTTCRNLPFYNIEIKSTPEGDSVFHPAPEQFVKQVMAVVNKTGIADRCIIQSFDVRSLQAAKSLNENAIIALLVENSSNPQENIRTLGFTPNIYSCDYNLLKKQDIEYLHNQNIKIIPWTVNSQAEMERLMKWGVDGIITDYPDQLISVQTTFQLQQFQVK